MNNSNVVGVFDHDCYETPEWLFDYYNKQYKFQLDAAANESNSKCLFYFKDALTVEWGLYASSIWCNPPYSDQKTWIKKAYKEAKKHNITVVLLVMAPNGGMYYHDYVFGHASKIVFFGGRISFLNPLTKQPDKSNRFGSVLVVYEKDNIDNGTTVVTSQPLGEIRRAAV